MNSIEGDMSRLIAQAPRHVIETLQEEHADDDQNEPMPQHNYMGGCWVSLHIAASECLRSPVAFSNGSNSLMTSPLCHRGNLGFTMRRAVDTRLLPKALET